MKTINLKRLLITMIVVIFTGQALIAQEPQKKKPALTHWMTPEELLRKDEIGRDFYPTDPPDAPVINIAEFNRMQGVLICYPFGINYNIIAEMSEDVVVTTIVSNQSQQNYVISLYQSNGVNLENCDFLQAPTDSYWTRDYGPWFVIDGNDEAGIVNFPYNRPRPDDNDIPIKVAEFLGINLFGMDLIHTGGNYMTDGMGISSSTELVWDENSGLTHQQVAQLVEDYLGIYMYYVVPDPNNTYINHIDCWGKFLDVDKILIREVPPSHQQYEEIEATAAYYAEQTSSYGNNYQVYRVYTPNDQPYTNSLILNDKVLLPVTGSQWDDDAIAAYEEAMPGYEVLGFTGSWQSTDALHCRTMGIADIGMLHINHFPILGDAPFQDEYEVEAVIKTLSGLPLYSDSVIVYYRVNGADWESANMFNTSGQTWTGIIPGAEYGSEIEYYIFASDESGRRETHPFIGEPDPHVFFVGGQAFAHIVVNPDSLYATACVGQSDVVSFDISNIGQLDLIFTISASTVVYDEYDFNVPDSPSPTSWNSNTYTELGWTDLNVGTTGEISGWEITYTWQTDDWPEEGSFHVESPSGTQAVIASGFPSGTYSVDLTDFNGEEMNGNWKIWIEDTYGDGGHQATNITLTITTIISEIPWLCVSPFFGTVPPGESVWVEVPCDASELEVGLYEGKLIIESNDPDYPELEIPVTFDVTECVDVTVTPDTLWFLTIEDMFYGKIINITNETNISITITDITQSGTVIPWEYDPPLVTLPYTLPAGEQLELNVVIPLPLENLETLENIIFEDLQITTEAGEHIVVIAWDSDLLTMNLIVTPDTLWFIDYSAIGNPQPFSILNDSYISITIYEIPDQGEVWYIEDFTITLPYELLPGEQLDFNVIVPPGIDNLFTLVFDSIPVSSDAGVNTLILAIDEDLLGSVSEFENSGHFSNNYPNPFSEEINIEFSLDKTEKVSVEIFDQEGRKINRLIDNEFMPGRHIVSWDAKNEKGQDVQNGIYFYRITHGGVPETVKIVLVR